MRLEGKTDQERFKELGWGLRTWDQWNFNNCDERFTDTGWKIIRRIECPLSSERLTGNMVQNMQDKRILGTIGRTLLIAKKHRPLRGSP